MDDPNNGGNGGDQKPQGDDQPVQGGVPPTTEPTPAPEAGDDQPAQG